MERGSYTYNSDPHAGMSHGTAREPTIEELQSLNPIKYGEQGLEEPLISPDMLIGTGIPSGIAKLVSKNTIKGAAPAVSQGIRNVSPPSVVIPSGISELKEYMLQREGAHGARRVERAADEVPNLENMYTPKALQDAFKGGWTGENRTAVMVMNPAHFEKYAPPILEFTDHDLNITNHAKYLNTLAARERHIKSLQSVKGFDEVPWLELYKGETQDPSIIPAVYAHEGRHRSRALARNGEQVSLVRMLPRAALGELPRSWQEEYIAALNKEMTGTDNKVVPQVYNVPANNSGSVESFEQGKLINRPAIQLPEMFASGGSVKQFEDRRSQMGEELRRKYGG